MRLITIMRVKVIKGVISTLKLINNESRHVFQDCGNDRSIGIQTPTG